MKVFGKKLYVHDIVLLVAFVLYFGAGFCTSFALAEIGKYTEFAHMVESNPTVRAALDLSYGILLLQFITVAIVGGLYYIIRRKAHRGELDYAIFGAYTIMVFLMFLENFLNDLPIALKLFLGG